MNTVKVTQIPGHSRTVSTALSEIPSLERVTFCAFNADNERALEAALAAL